jgi:hypothetical protein
MVIMNKRDLDLIKQRYDTLDHATIADIHGLAVNEQNYDVIKETTTYTFYNGFFFERDETTNLYTVKYM